VALPLVEMLLPLDDPESSATSHRVEVIKGRFAGRHGLVVGRSAITSFASAWVRWDGGETFGRPSCVHFDELVLEATGDALPQSEIDALAQLSIRELSRSDLSSSLNSSLIGDLNTSTSSLNSTPPSEVSSSGRLTRQFCCCSDDQRRGETSSCKEACLKAARCGSLLRPRSDAPLISADAEACTPPCVKAAMLRRCINLRRSAVRDGPLCVRRALTVALIIAALLAPLMFAVALTVRLVPPPLGYSPELATKRASRYNDAVLRWDDGCALDSQKPDCMDKRSELNVFAHLKISVMLPRLDAMSLGLVGIPRSTTPPLPVDVEADATTSFAFEMSRGYALAAPPRCAWHNGSADCPRVSGEFCCCFCLYCSMTEYFTNSNDFYYIINIQVVAMMVCWASLLS